MSPTLENKGQHPCDYLRSVKVISQQEWQRLNDQLNREAIEQKKLEDQHLANEKLKQQSQEMVKNWTNTFLGARQKKLDERAKRLADEEKAKIAIDIEEAKFQAEQRKAAIEEAKLKLYYQTDRVKRFHSALTLAETLKERDVQLEFKELCKERNAEKERVYIEQMKKEMEAAALKEQQEAADRKAKNFAVASEVVRQIKEREENQKKEHEEMLLEGEQLKRLLIEDQQERERLLQTDKQQASELRKFYLEQIEDNEQIRTIERLKEEEEDEKRRIFAAAKKKMMTLRMLKERELFEAREAEMERIRNSLSEQMKQKKDDEEERIARVIAQREEAERLKESEKAKATAKLIAEIEAHRLETIQRHRREQEEAKLAELEEVRARNAANRMVAEREAACAAQRNERIREMSRDHLENARRRREEMKAEREREIGLVDGGNKLAMREEKLFQDYANRVIEHCKEGGRNVFPLQMAAKPKGSFGLASALPGEKSLLEFGDPEGREQENGSNVTPDNSGRLPAIGENMSSTDSTKEHLGFVW